MNDTRPFERIQHSDAYGHIILKLYGKDAWKEWKRTVALQYGNIETRVNPCHKQILNPKVIPPNQESPKP